MYTARIREDDVANLSRPAEFFHSEVSFEGYDTDFSDFASS